MKKLISLALAIVMIMCLGTTAFAATVDAPGDYTADVTGSYVAGNESSGTVYCVDITWSDLDFTYHAEKGAVWNPDTLKYSEVEPAYWEGEGSITISNRSNTKITAAPKYTPAEGYADTGMDFSTDKLRVASAESGTAQSGTITVTANGFLPAMDEADTIGTITLTIAQDTDVTVAEAEALSTKMGELHGRIPSSEAGDYTSVHHYREQLQEAITNYTASNSDENQATLNSAYQTALATYNQLKDKY